MPVRGLTHRPLPTRRRKITVLVAILALLVLGVVPGERIGRLMPTTDPTNSAVTVPEHPEGASFNPNQIKDIKAADPGSQVNLIEAPGANNQGDARLNF